MTLLEHKGSSGSVEFSEADGVCHGKLQLIRGLVTYEATDAEGLRRAFEEAVEDYLELQATLARPPRP